jgi:ATP/maltotriose-dependent transcriptional regulator MalT
MSYLSETAAAAGRAVTADSQRTLCLVLEGDSAAPALFEQCMIGVNTDRPEADFTATQNLVELLAAAVLLRDEESAEKICKLLAPAAAILGTSGSLRISCPARHLGAAAALLGRPAEARDYYRQALDICERVRFRPEIALIHLGLAELLQESFPGERLGAIAQLNFAIAEFEAMGMQPSLNDALRLRDRGGRGTAVREIYPDELSEREVEVLRLLAVGMSNQQIAEELVISLNTVARHVSNIFDKTGTANRTGAAAYAHRKKLV